VLDPSRLTIQPGRVPVHLAGVEHGIAAATDVDERCLHAGQHVLDLAEVHVAGHAGARGPGHVVLHQDAVLEDRDLGAVVDLSDDHLPIDGLAAGEELGLGEHGGPTPALVASFTTPLPLGLQPRGALQARDLVALGARLAHVHHGALRIVGRLLTLGVRTTPTPPTTATTGSRLALGRFFVVLGPGLSRLGLVARCPLGLGSLAPPAAAATPASATTTGALVATLVVTLVVRVGVCVRSGDG